MPLVRRSVIFISATALALTATPGLQALQTSSETKKAVAAGKADAAAKIEVLGLSVTKPGPTDLDQPGPPMRFGSFVREGTNVTLLVMAPGRTILSFDPKASKLTSFEDDKKTDLLKAKPNPKDQGMIFHFGRDESSPLQAENSASALGRSCLVEVKAPAWPASGASKITLKATLVFQVRGGREDRCAEGCRLHQRHQDQRRAHTTHGEPQARARLPPERPRPAGAQHGTEVTFEMDQPLTAIKSIDSSSTPTARRSRARGPGHRAAASATPSSRHAPTRSTRTLRNPR